jgi:phosphomannomutase
VLKRISEYYSADVLSFDDTYGISLEFAKWRMNVRASNTEPLLRLNVETRADNELVQEKVSEIEGLIKAAS